mgnify:CR=1 FL=1
MLDWIFDRLRERSTWMSIAGALTAAGVLSDPDQAELFAGAGIAVISFIGAITRG